LQEQIQQLQAQLAAVPALPPADPPAPPHIPLPPPNLNPVPPVLPPPAQLKIKIATPDTFTGDRNKADSFLSQLYLYFNARPADFPTDGQRILFALSYMKGGTAGPWADRFVEQVEAGQPPAQTWADFRESFRRTFADPDPGATARLRMSQLRQGTRVVDLYIAEFQELAARTNYDDVAHIDHFERGLSRRLIDAIYLMNNMPTTLMEWYQAAQKFDLQLRKLEQHHKERPTSVFPRFIPRTNFPKPIAPRPPTSGQGPVPMDLDSGLRNRRPLICYKCRKEGHMARNCPEKAQVIRVVEEPPKDDAAPDGEAKDGEKGF
jgi:hypothetical protein